MAALVVPSASFRQSQAERRYSSAAVVIWGFQAPRPHERNGPPPFFVPVEYSFLIGLAGAETLGLKPNAETRDLRVINQFYLGILLSLLGEGEPILRHVEQQALATWLLHRAR